jgi:hypothetical protein
MQGIPMIGYRQRDLRCLAAVVVYKDTLFIRLGISSSIECDVRAAAIWSTETNQTSNQNATAAVSHNESQLTRMPPS